MVFWNTQTSALNRGVRERQKCNFVCKISKLAWKSCIHSLLKTFLPRLSIINFGRPFALTKQSLIAPICQPLLDLFSAPWQYVQVLLGWKLIQLCAYILHSLFFTLTPSHFSPSFIMPISHQQNLLVINVCYHFALVRLSFSNHSNTNLLPFPVKVDWTSGFFFKFVQVDLFCSHKKNHSNNTLHVFFSGRRCKTNCFWVMKRGLWNFEIMKGNQTWPTAHLRSTKITVNTHSIIVLIFFSLPSPLNSCNFRFSSSKLPNCEWNGLNSYFDALHSVNMQLVLFDF